MRRERCRDRDRGVAEREAVRVSPQTAERALAAIVRIASTAIPGAPLASDEERQVAALLDDTDDPSRLARAARVGPERLAYLCMRIIRARR